MRPAEKMKQIPPSSTLRVLGLAKELERQGKRILHMEVGEPDFDTPEHIKQAANEALRKGMTKYTPSQGMVELREAIAEDIRKRGFDADPANIIVTPGAKHAIFCALVAALDPGDEVIIPSPCWTYKAMVQLAGGKPVFVETKAEGGFVPDPERVLEAITPKTRMLLLNYPSNPTGAVLDRAQLKPLVDIAVDKGFWILSDEIYDRLVYEGEHASPLSLDGAAECTIYINGFSKTYAMTGWRLGYAMAPKDLVTEMVKVQQASTSCVPAFVQMAGIAALRGPQDSVEQMCSEYQKRRDLIVKHLSAIEDISCFKPRGAFYVFPSIKELGISSLEFCERLLKEKGVAAVPGSGFGPFGEGHVRFSYATSPAVIKEAMALLKELVEEIRAGKKR